jgi:hypothetical protein
MSTYQPGEPSSFAPPQDPWSGPHGVAATPTDPIPQPAPGQFAPGVAAPAPRVWSQETISHDDGYGYVPQRRGAGRYVLVILLVLVLGGAGGFGAWYLITNNFPGTPGAQNSREPSATPSTSTSPEPPAFEPADVRVGDCLVNNGTATATNMAIAPCDTAGSYKVVKIIPGLEIPEDVKISTREEAQAAAGVLCTGTGYEAYFGWDHPDRAQDFFFCMTVND